MVSEPSISLSAGAREAMGEELKQPTPLATSEDKETILEMLVKLNASLDRILGSSPSSPTSTTALTTGSMASPNHDIGDKHSTAASPLSGASEMACTAQCSQAKEAHFGACRVFDEMPDHQKANTGRVLRVTVSQVFYSVTEEVLHQVFDAYGAEKVCDLEVADRTEALVLFRSSHDAVRARDACHGRCIYDNCCWLDLQYVQPLPTNNTPVMPGKCSTPRLSHDVEKPKAASTPVAASTMALSTSVAMATTSFAQIKAEQPGACKVFVGMPRKTESEAKYPRFVKWVRITRRPVRWAMRSKHGSSGCEVEVSDVKEDKATQGDVLDTELKHTIKLDIKQPTKVFDEMTLKVGVMEGKTDGLSLWEEGYYTSTRQWQTLVVSGDHVVFVEMPKDGKPQELPSQENFMAWLQPDQAIGVKSLVVEMGRSPESSTHSALLLHQPWPPPTLTADWKLQRRIIKFDVFWSSPTDFKRLIQFKEACVLDYESGPYNVIGEAIRDWNLDQKFFSLISVGDIRNHESTSKLKDMLIQRNCLPIRGELYNIASVDDVLNNIVSKGQPMLQLVGDILERFVQAHASSSLTQQQLLEIVTNMGLKCPQGDVKWWHNIYFRFEVLLHFKKAFPSEELLSAEDIKIVESICKILRAFYRAIEVVSGHACPTANMYFHELWKVLMILQEEASTDHTEVANMVREMQEAFNEYWHDSDSWLSVPVVLDPRSKITLDGFHSDSLEDWDLHLSAQRSQLLTELDNYLEDGLVPTEKGSGLVSCGFLLKLLRATCWLESDEAYCGDLIKRIDLISTILEEFMVQHSDGANTKLQILLAHKLQLSWNLGGLEIVIASVQLPRSMIAVVQNTTDVTNRPWARREEGKELTASLAGFFSYSLLEDKQVLMEGDMSLPLHMQCQALKHVKVGVG